MSRIRSVHPGLWTDEAFVCLSDAAQIFFIGLWTECDDQGAFEWKPVQLRLKLRGNRDGSIEPILAELEDANCIMRYEVGGRSYGLVRNFLRFQRPKKPNSVHPVPAELRTYTASGDLSSPPVPHQFHTGGEKSPQMEDGGGNSGIVAREPLAHLESQLREAAGWQSEPAPMLAVTGEVQALIDSGADLELDVLPVVRALAPKCGNRVSWRYFLNAIARQRDQRTAAASIVTTPTAPQHRTPHATRTNTIAAGFDLIDRAIAERERQLAAAQGGQGRGEDDPFEVPRLRQVSP